MLKIEIEKLTEMEQRPKIKLELTLSDKIFEVTGWLLIFAVWGLTITNYNSLPKIIATHYNGAGAADGFGEKRSIFALPLIATIFFAGLTVLNKFPHIFNYPTKITKDNAISQYTNATRLIRYLKLIVVGILGIISYKTIRLANGLTEGLGVWFLPLTIAIINAPLIYFMIRSYQPKK